jgi:hypothetical protein
MFDEFNDFDDLALFDEDEALYPKPRSDDALTLITWAIPKALYGFGYVALWSIRAVLRVARWYLRW